MSQLWQNLNQIKTELAEFMDKSKIAHQLATELLERLAVAAEAEVEEDSEAGMLKIEISGENLGILIGRHGETLQALQLVLGLMLHKALGEWQPLILDIDGWRARREEQLKMMAERSTAEAIASGREQILPPMPAFERRIIHLHLTDHDQVTTESSGEEPERQVIIKPKL